jgi:hypothetical protein
MYRGAIRDACLVGMRFSITAWTFGKCKQTVTLTGSAITYTSSTSEPWSCGTPHAKSRLACRKIGFPRKCPEGNPMKVELRDLDDPIWLEVNNERRILEPIGKRLWWLKHAEQVAQEDANLGKCSIIPTVCPSRTYSMGQSSKAGTISCCILAAVCKAQLVSPYREGIAGCFALPSWVLNKPRKNQTAAQGIQST